MTTRTDQACQIGGRLFRWRAGERKTVYLCAIVLAACAFLLLIYLQKIWAEHIVQTPGHPPPFGDFLALWSYARIAAAHPVTDLYDFATLHAEQVALGMNATAQNPFPYPPTFLLAVAPLAWLPYEAAYLVWTFGTLALFVWAVAATCSRLPLCLIAAVVAPASTVEIDAGQTGFLSAALAVAGIRLARARPVLSGVLIGALSIKPQLGILIPVALVAAGCWRAVGVACATVAGLAAVATWAFGWSAWQAWIDMLPAYAEMFDRQQGRLAFMPTVMANLRLAGLEPSVARVLQAVAAIAVAVLVWRQFRRCPGQLAAGGLLVGTFLATPHALIYDLPMVTAGMALFIQQRVVAGADFALGDVIILLLTLMFPALMAMVGASAPVSTVPLLLMFGLILWHARPVRAPVAASVA